MLITCPACASEYRIDSQRIGSAGQRVRCAHCRETWFVSGGTGGATATPGPTGTGGASVVVDTIEPPAPAAAATPLAGTDDEREAAALPHVRRGPLRRPVRREARPLAPRLAVAGAALACLLAPAAIVLRGSVAAAVPASGSLFAAIGLPVNIAGVTVAEVSSHLATEGGAKVLLVEGRIENGTRAARAVPRIDLTIRDEEGRQLYRWSVKPPQAELAAGDAAPFRIRLPSPPPAGHDLAVTFEPPGGSVAVASR